MYRFPLQAVLNHRQLVEDTLKSELAQIKKTVRSEEQLLDTLKRKEMKTVTNLADEQTSGMSSHQIIPYHIYLEHLFERIRTQEKRLEKTKAEKEKKHREVLDAVKRRKMLEKLKAQGIDRYRRMILDQETKLIDEISVVQHTRNAKKPIGKNK